MNFSRRQIVAVTAAILSLVLYAAPLGCWAWQSQTDDKNTQNVPDAPSATPGAVPAQANRKTQLPATPEPQPGAGQAPQNQEPATGTAPTPPPTASPQSQPAAEGSETQNSQQPAKPPANVTTVPPGQATNAGNSPRDQMYTLTSNVSFVVVPVTVKDENGRMVDGLVQKDFAVYEDGSKQKISLFTSDPFPLSAAVVLDTGMPNVAWRRVGPTLPALEGAFSQFDEVSIYTYSNIVHKVVDFSAVSQRLDQVVRNIKQTEEGAPGGAPVVGGPMQSGPTVNGMPADPGAPAMVNSTPVRVSHVLNDAVLAAALELSKRDPTRRKVIFIVSDGHEWGSNASYSDVLKVLLSHNVTVYAVAVDAAAIPGLSRLERLHIPRLGEGNILPKYASATGGQVFPELTREAIETAYQQVTREARNQYTLGYNSKATMSGAYRTIDVRVAHGGLFVYAKSGYYPLPPPRH